ERVLLRLDVEARVVLLRLEHEERARPTGHAEVRRVRWRYVFRSGLQLLELRRGDLAVRARRELRCDGRAELRLHRLALALLLGREHERGAGSDRAAPDREHGLPGEERLRAAGEEHVAGAGDLRVDELPRARAVRDRRAFDLRLAGHREHRAAAL